MKVFVDWVVLCGHKDGENFTVWSQNDFNPCFATLVLKIFPHFLFGFGNFFYLWMNLNFLTMSFKKNVLFTRPLVAFCHILSSSLFFVLSYKTSSNLEKVNNVLVCLVWVFHILYLFKLERWMVLYDKSFPLVFCLGFLLITRLVFMRSLFLRRSKNIILNYEDFFSLFDSILDLVYFVSYFILLRNKKQFDWEGEREECPENKASLFSRIFFTWLNPLMKNIKDKKITEVNQIFLLPPDLNTGSLIEKYHRTKDSMGLKRHLLKLFGFRYFFLGVLKFFSDIFSFCSPIFLNFFLTFLTSTENENWGWGLFYLCLLFSSSFSSSLLITQFDYRIMKMGLRIKTVLTESLFTKIFSTSQSELASHSNEGQIFNLLSTDVDRVINFCGSFHQFWSLPFQVAVVLYLLYLQVGLAFLAGIIFALFLIPINKIIAFQIARLTRILMSQKDSRIKLSYNILQNLRSIKLLAWEDLISSDLEKFRKLELITQKKRKYLDALCVFFWATTPIIISILTFVTYVIMGNNLTSSKVFTSISLFALLIGPLNAYPWVINGLMESLVSLQRIQSFLGKNKENINLSISLSTPFSTPLSTPPSPFSQEESISNDKDEKNELCKGNFTWGGEGGKGGGTRNFILQNINFNVSKGNFVGVGGKVGSGKTSLLLSILGELQSLGETKMATNSQYLHGNIGFYSQKPWLQRGTLRSNILFGNFFEKEWYDKVIKSCDLDNDFKLFPLGDLTLIGEDGVKLSGGQRARVALARTVYQKKSIYLLDDPYSSLDVRIGNHVHKHVTLGLLASTTRIVTSSNLSFLKEAEEIFFMDGGKIRKEENISQFSWKLSKSVFSQNKIKDGEKEEFKNKKIKINEEDENEDDQLLSIEDNKEEEDEEGYSNDKGLDLKVYMIYIKACGFFLSFFILLFVLLMQASRNVCDWWLSYWISHFNSTPPANFTLFFSPSSFFLSNNLNQNSFSWIQSFSLHFPPPPPNDVSFYLKIYAGLGCLTAVFAGLRAFTFALGGIQAAKITHQNLINKIFGSNLSCFSEISGGKILNRLSADTFTLDDSLPFILNIFLAQSFSILGTIFICFSALPLSIPFVVVLAFIYYYIQTFYRSGSRLLKRLSCVTLTPLLSSLEETLAGLVIIRSHKKEMNFHDQLKNFFDLHLHSTFASNAIIQWLNIRLQMMGVSLVSLIGLVAIFQKNYSSISPSLTGLAISYVLSINSQLSGLLLSMTETEKSFISVERIHQMEEALEQEFLSLSFPLQFPWPSLGQISFKNVTLFYKGNSSPALKNITFSTKPGEKLGVVGRTGSGKSSLFSALMRIHPISMGSILLDEVDVREVDLIFYRSQIAMIPQDPFLLEAPLRFNLDPKNFYSDNKLIKTLKKCQIWEIFKKRKGLGSEVKSLSQGQKQLICLARALLSNSRIILMDEATSSVDESTERRIQGIFKQYFKDKTVIIIAHKLTSVINCHRLLVLNEGKLVESGPPNQLINDNNSLFNSLIRDFY